MFKRQASSHMKIIGRSGYFFAFVMPFISFSVDSKASNQIASENKLFVTSNQNIDSQFNNSSSKNILNFKFENLLIAEDLSNKSKKIYIKTCTKKDPNSGGSEEENKYWNKCSMKEAAKSEQGRELMKKGSQSLPESCLQGICNMQLCCPGRALGALMINLRLPGADPDARMYPVHNMQRVAPC